MIDESVRVCAMWTVLRPVEGGPGYDEEALKHLRTLNFELE